MIHPTAIVHPQARVDGTVEVGPYAVIDGGVTVGPGCVLGPHAYLTGVTHIGARNIFHAGCVIGNIPQDLKYKGDPTGLRIGDKNVFREHSTVNSATEMGEDTVVGSNNLLMAGSHVAHNCRVGNRVIMGNGSMLAGHVIVDDKAIISGSCLIHQFVHIGTLAMMQGGAAISKDLPPFTVARGYNNLGGLNIIGLRRAGITAEERLELKKVYRMVFREGRVLRLAVEEALTQFKSPAARTLLEFVAASKRGVVAHRSRSDDGEDEDGE
jgi:UDP-N-acetylglucosamine acyltransferase